MATRRPFGLGGRFSQDADGEFFGGEPLTDDGLMGASPPTGSDAGFGAEPPQDLGALGEPFREGDDAGSSMRARELMPTRPNTYGSLPEGVTVPQAQFSGVPESSNVLQTPLSPRAPSPIAMQPQTPNVLASESGVGPQRPSFTSRSVLFGESPARAGLFGGAGGLDQGGYGVMSTEGGAPSPTALMLQLVRMLNSGGAV